MEAAAARARAGKGALYRRWPSKLALVVDAINCLRPLPPLPDRGSLRADLEARLRKFVPEAVVTVAVKALVGNRVFIVGKVLKSGDFLMNRPIDVMQAIALAGGASPFANLNGIRILRRSGGKLASIPFNYGDVESGRRLEQNILLQGGDTVVVP